MTNRLAPIIEQKKRDIAALYTLLQAHPDHAIGQLLQGHAKRERTQNFKQALRKDSLAVIAEIKRQSPSRGELAQIADPVALAHRYIEGNADALSILTDELFFKGKLSDLESVSKRYGANPTPILRKDFVLDVSQIAEAISAGADAILAIVAILGKTTKTILSAAKSMGIDVLVEVHTKAELMLALDCGAEIIGVNNRDLTTFEVEVDRAFDLLALIPKEIVSVAESGIRSPDLAHAYRQAGFDAVLIGEALVTSDAPDQFIRGCRRG